MNYQLRILLCRAGFLLFCVLPTTVVAGWILLRSTGGFATAQKAEWERTLTDRLGLIVEIDQVCYLRNCTARLGGFRLLDPETRNVVAGARQLEIVATTDGWQVAAGQLVVEGSQLGLLARTIEQRILRGKITAEGQKRATSIQLGPSDILVRRPGDEQTLKRFGGTIQLSEECAALQVSFQLPGSPTAAEPIRLTALRNRAHSPAATHWQLSTAEHAVPCSLATDLVPELICLGRECQFRGMVQVGDSADRTSGRLVGTLTHVDLDALVSERFPHRLSGLATVRIEQGLIERGRLVELRGTAQATGGAIGQSLVTAAAQHLGLIAAAESANDASAVVSFRQLAIGFHLTGRSLALAGSPDPLMDGVLIGNAAGPILTAPPQHSVAAVNLLRTLLPDNEYQVPATQQTAALVRLLPVPELVPTKTDNLPSHTPTRLAPAAAQSPPTYTRQPVLR